MNLSKYFSFLQQKPPQNLFLVSQIRYLKATIYVCLLAAFFLTIESLFRETARPYLAANIFSLLFLVFALILIQRGHVILTGNLFVWALFAITSYTLLFVDQDLRSLSTIGFFVLVPLSGFITIRYRFIVMISVTALALIIVQLGNEWGILNPELASSTTLGHVFIVLFGLGMTYLFLHIYEYQITQVARELADTNQKLQESQQKLQKNQEELEKRVQSRTSALSDTNRELRHEIQLREQAELDLREREERLQTYHYGLQKIAKSEALAQGNLAVILQEITETAAQLLNVQRTSIWFFDENQTKIECQDLYLTAHDRHYQGFELLATDFPAYFQAVSSTRTFAAVNAHQDPRTAELSDPYLKKYQVESMLEAPIRIGQTVIGVMCNESVEQQRHWLREEEHFAGSLADFVALAVQVHKRKVTEKALRISEEQYRLVTETAKDAIITIDENNQIHLANSAVEKIFGYKKEDLIGQSLNILIPPELRSLHTTRFKAFIKHNIRSLSSWQSLNFPVLHKEGHRISTEVSIGEFQNQSQHFFTAIMRDVTRRKEQEHALQASEERYRSIVELSPDGIYIAQNGHIKYANQALATMFGFETPDQLLHQSWKAFIHEDDLSTAAEMCREVTQGAPLTKPCTVRFVNRQQKVIESEVIATQVEYDQQLAGQFVVRDLTERKQMEQALWQSHKLESLGILAGGIAHDFNNLLVAIMGHSSLALTQLSEGAIAHRAIGKSLKAAERASELTRQLLAYSGRGKFEVRVICLNNLITENLHLFRVAIPKEILLHTHFDDTLPDIEVDVVQIQQIVMNLLINASDAVAGRSGQITLETNTLHLWEEQTENWLGVQEALPAGAYACLTVADNGQGIPPEQLAHIFDPFYTTKKKGHGLGLAAVLGIVRSHHGGLRVSSEPGRGTTFELIFPALTNETKQEHKSHEKIVA